MIYYSGLILIIYIIYMVSKQLENTHKSKMLFCGLACIFVSLFQGFRSFTVGTDLASYIPSFRLIGERITNFNDLTFLNFEPGYVLYNKLLYMIGFDERGFLLVTALLIQLPIFYTIYKNSREPFLSILVYFAFSNFIMTFSGLRQAITMGLCFFGYNFIKKRRFFLYLIMIIIASTFHSSVLFCLILYPLYYMKLDRKKVLWILCMLFVTFIFRTQVIQIANIIYYGETKELISTNAYTMLFMYSLLLLISYGFKSNEIEYTGLRNFLFLLCLVYTLAPVSNIFTRLGYPISLYLTLLVPKITGKINVKPSNIIKNAICYVICISCFFYFIGELNTLPFSFM